MGKRRELPPSSRIPLRRWRRTDGNRWPALGSGNCCGQASPSPAKMRQQCRDIGYSHPLSQGIPCKTLNTKKKSCNSTVEEAGRLHLRGQSGPQLDTEKAFLQFSYQKNITWILLFGGTVSHTKLRLAPNLNLPCLHFLSDGL